MNRMVLPLLCGMGLCLTGVQANADQDQVQISNLTFSGGVISVPYGANDFPVSDDVTFNNLTLTETFGNSTVVPDTLFDSSNVAQTSLGSILSPDGNILTGNVFDTTANGGLTAITLNGTLSLTTLNVYNSPLPATTTQPTTVDVNFSATYSTPTTGGSINFYATDNSGSPFAAQYAIGTLSLVNVGPPQATVPEPNCFAFLAAVSCGLVSMLALRRRARRA